MVNFDVENDEKNKSYEFEAGDWNENGKQKWILEN